MQHLAILFSTYAEQKCDYLTPWQSCCSPH